MAETYAKDTELDTYIPVFFLQNGKPAPYYVLNDPISNQAAGFWSCITDLDESVSYLDILKGMLTREDVPYQAKKALYLSAVITYMRCFNEGEGRPVKLDFNQVFLDIKQKEFHKEIRDVRNKNFAHAGGGAIDSQRVILYFDPENVVSGRLESKINVLHLAFGHDIDRFKYLINITKRFVQTKLDSLLPKFQSNVLKMGIAELYAKSKIPDSANFVKW